VCLWCTLYARKTFDYGTADLELDWAVYEVSLVVKLIGKFRQNVRVEKDLEESTYFMLHLLHNFFAVMEEATGKSFLSVSPSPASFDTLDTFINDYWYGIDRRRVHFHPKKPRLPVESSVGPSKLCF
jgi:hypothetical protein